MKAIETVLQIASFICGLYAAYLWWQSSNTIQKIAAPPIRGTGVGDQLLQLGPNEYIVYNYGTQAKLNKSAAKWTAISIGLQAAASMLALPLHG